MDVLVAVCTDGPLGVVIGIDEQDVGWSLPDCEGSECEKKENCSHGFQNGIDATGLLLDGLVVRSVARGQNLMGANDFEMGRII